MIQAQVLSMPTTLSMLRPFHCSPSKAWRRVLNPISMFRWKLPVHEQQRLAIKI